MNVYDSIVDSIQELDPSTRGEIYTAVIEYLRFEREPDLEGMSQIAKSKAGKRGGKSGSGDSKARHGNQNASRTQADETENASKTQAKRKQNASEQEQEQEVEKPSANAEGKKRSARFVPPSPEEVDAYIAEKGYHGFTGQQFCNYYEASGWMRGKTKVKDWRACVRTWAGKRSGPARDGPQRPLPDFSAYALPTEEVPA